MRSTLLKKERTEEEEQTTIRTRLGQDKTTNTRSKTGSTLAEQRAEYLSECMNHGRLHRQAPLAVRCSGCLGPNAMGMQQGIGGPQVVGKVGVSRGCARGYGAIRAATG